MKSDNNNRSSLCFVSSISLLLVTGLADNSSTSGSKKSSGGTSVGVTILIVCLCVAVAAFSVFLFKLWQRKKREEQHAQLLKLFEQDDDLEVELGLRD